MAAITATAITLATVRVGYVEANGRASRTQRQLDAVTGLVARMADVKPGTVTGEGLKPVGPLDKLPGSKLQLTPDAALIPKRSAVAVFDRLRQPGAPQTQICSGVAVLVKVGEGVEKDVLTAGHCTPPNRLYPMGTRTARVDQNGPELSIGDPANGLGDNQSAITPDDLIDVIAASTFLDDSPDSPDLTLLRIDQHSNSPFFKSLNPIPIGEIGGTPPSLGAPIVAYSLPGITTDKPVTQEGFYLGRVQNVDGTANKVDVVALPGNDATHDACEHNGSGSFFVAPKSDTTVYISATLRGRMRIGSEKNLPQGDHQDTQLGATTALLKTEEQLGLNLIAASNTNASFGHVLCTYTMISPQNVQDLIAGFNR